MGRLLIFLKRLDIMLATFFAVLAIAAIVAIGRNELTCFGENLGEFRSESQFESETYRSQILNFSQWYQAYEAKDYVTLLDERRQQDYAYFSAVNNYWGAICALSAQSKALGLSEKEPKFTIYAQALTYSFRQVVGGLYENTFGFVFSKLKRGAKSEMDFFFEDISRAIIEHRNPERAADDRLKIALSELSNTPKASFFDWERAFVIWVKLRSLIIGETALARLGYDMPQVEKPFRVVLNGVTEFQLARFADRATFRGTNTGLEVIVMGSEAANLLLKDVAQVGGAIRELGQSDLVLVATERAMDAPPIYSYPRSGHIGERYLYWARVEDLANLIRTYEVDQIFP